MRSKRESMLRHPMAWRHDVQTVCALGFGLVITLLLIVIVGNYHATRGHNVQLAEQARAAGSKAAAAYAMREAIHDRIDALNAMAHSADPFERDEHTLRYIAHAADYARARAALSENLTTGPERAIVAHLDAGIADIGRPDGLVQAALSNAVRPGPEIQAAVQIAIEGHQALLRHLDEAVDSIRQSTQQHIRDTNGEIREALMTEMLLGLLAFVLAVVTAALVVINAGARNRQLTYQAAHDALTGLLNRQAFETSLRLTLEQSRVSRDSHALFLIDLDRFRLVNESCGHGAGDALLRELSQRLLHTLRHSDVLARIGGDEFGVLLRHTTPIDAERVAEKMRRTIAGFTFRFEDQTYEVGASIGMVPFGSEATTVEDLLKTADTCCSSAKEEGRNRIHHAESDIDKVARRSGEMLWVRRIKDALRTDGFGLYGQLIKPLNSRLEDGRLVLEVLLRMKDEGGLGVIPPGQFLPAAEHYGIVPDIDRWVVHNSLTWLAGLGNNAEHVRININICGPSASDPQFHRFVRDCINQSGVPPRSLCFEITESAAIRSLANAAALVDALGDLGCQFALDDFGSGLSSFNQLRHLKVDYLKIDGSFIHNIDRDPINRALVESINSIGKKLGKRTVAEFVENDRIKHILQEIDVDFAQGFGLHRPEPLSDIRRQFLQAQDPGHTLVVA